MKLTKKGYRSVYFHIVKQEESRRIKKNFFMKQHQKNSKFLSVQYDLHSNLACLEQNLWQQLNVKFYCFEDIFFPPPPSLIQHRRINKHNYFSFSRILYATHR